MWSDGRHFRTSQIDERRTTNDCDVMGNFDTITDEARYCGIIKKILKIDFRTFRTYIFECRWFDGVSRRHESGIYMVDSTKTYKGKYDNFVLPKNCEQVGRIIFFEYVRMYVPRNTNVTFSSILVGHLSSKHL